MDVKTVCLGALTLGDATGYEIRKLFEEGPFSHFYDASYGSIYPALGRALAEGLVSVTEMTQEGRPDKKVYSLTEKGERVLKKALRQTPIPDKVRSEYVARLFFADYMDEATLKNVYENYLNEIKTLAEQCRESDDFAFSASRRFTRGLGLHFYESVVSYMEENREQFFSSIREEKDNEEKNTDIHEEPIAVAVGAGDDD